jgi:hypothetical protein
MQDIISTHGNELAAYFSDSLPAYSDSGLLSNYL